MHVQEQIQLSRECIGVMVPSGQQVLIPDGTDVGVVQSLGGSFTVKIHGRLFRIDGKDADALGKEPPPEPKLPEGANDSDVEALIWQQLKGCFDPEIPIDIVELGLVYRCQVFSMDQDRRRVEIDMTLTAPGCGMGDVIAEDVERKVLEVPTIGDARVEVVFDPPWNHSMMSESARLELGVF
jgi:probable FeS assembly SUF system protein SufT